MDQIKFGSQNLEYIEDQASKKEEIQKARVLYRQEAAEKERQAAEAKRSKEEGSFPAGWGKWGQGVFSPETKEDIIIEKYRRELQGAWTQKSPAYQEED